jgi:hypothetical protein
LRKLLPFNGCQADQKEEKMWLGELGKPAKAWRRSPALLE